MLPSRIGFAAQPNVRKSKDARPSMLPKPRRPASIERQSIEARRPGTMGYRSSSADPPRPTLGAPRLSRETPANKIPFNRRSRSQQGDRYMTPLQSGIKTTSTPKSLSQQSDKFRTPVRSRLFSRGTTTPQRTPSEDRVHRTWQSCYERILSFVTIKDDRPISNVAWQRAEYSRVTEGLAALCFSNGTEVGGGMTLVRPLTITRFVEITGALLTECMDVKLISTDNYITKLPHLMKRLLYPGTVSKSWLKAANTLHAFPQALALIGYLLDLVQHLELPVSEENLYSERDEISCLRRAFLQKSWNIFQTTMEETEEPKKEYLEGLRALLGNNDEKIAQLENVIKSYEDSLDDEVELAERADMARRVEIVSSLKGELRDVYAERGRCRSETDTQLHRQKQLVEQTALFEQDIERASADVQRLRAEVDSQPMSTSERARLLDELHYALKVQDSKRALAEQIEKMVLSKEEELVLWQKKVLDSCVEYKQSLIHLSVQFPELTSLAVDEKELMDSGCAARLARAVDDLRDVGTQLSERRADQARNKTKLARKRAALVEETRAKIAENKLLIQSEQEALESENAKEMADLAAWNQKMAEISNEMQELKLKHEEYMKIERDLSFWEEQDTKWRNKLSQLKEYIGSQREKSTRLMQSAKNKREQLFLEKIAQWKEILQ